MKTPIVKCPTCHNPSEFAETNPFRPFCCERCQLVDLGQWASEEYRVPVSPVLPDENAMLHASDESSVDDLFNRGQ